jgi:membrane-bound lytic murein transglycosylase A
LNRDRAGGAVRSLSVFISGLVLLGLLFLAAAWIARGALGPAQLALSPREFAALPGWASDDPRPALEALSRSCARLAHLADDRPMGGAADPSGVPLYGLVGDWRPVCQALSAGAIATPDAARTFFEQHFVPLRASNAGRAQGLFTGYYEAEAEGSLAPGGRFQTPLLKRPFDLVSVDLGAFRDALKGQRIAGRVVEGRLAPYASRAEIERGTPDLRQLAFVWLANPVDAFFLHIQGSGRVRLAEGGTLRVGYDGQNGHPYTPIGRRLKDMGALDKDHISMQTIRAWLAAHPEEGRRVMEENASYIFLKALAIDDPTLGPLGAQEIPLAPGRSLAVDRKFHALGVPMWLDTSLPTDDAGTPGPAFRRLMIAQDTGGAIRGPVRGDVFFGFGEEAARLGGWMKQKGRLYVLLPKPLAARLKAGGR